MRIMRTTGWTMLFFLTLVWPAKAFDGPLKKSNDNPRYFTDNSGRAIYLTGSHNWGVVQDVEGAGFCPDFDCYINFMAESGHNYLRMWMWESSVWFIVGIDPHAISPLPFMRTGPGDAADGKPKFNFEEYDESYFARLKDRVAKAQAKGIYVSVMLFNGTSAFRSQDWAYHMFKASNNINGINGDYVADGIGKEIHTLANPDINLIQENYVKKVIDTVNEYDNVMYEIGNELYEGNSYNGFQYHIIDLIHNYESTKLKQHPVGMSVSWPQGNINDLFNSPAEWISPGDVAYINDPPLADGRKVVFVDTDHLGDWFIEAPIWKNFTRGNNPVLMDPRSDLCDAGPSSPSYNWDLCDPPIPEILRVVLGNTRSYAEKMDLVHAVPSRNASDCSTTYCLRNDQGREYLIYQPENDDFTANVQAGDYIQEWFNPQTGSLYSRSNISVVASGNREFLNPFNGDAVLYLKAGSILPLQNTLVAAYSFNEGSGNSVRDASGQNNSGQISGATWFGGKFGQSLSFDGVNDWVTVADSDRLDLTSGMTLEAWISPTRNSGYQTVMMKEYSYFNSEGANDFAYALFLNLDRIMGGLRVSGEGDDIYGVNIPTNGAWTHVAFTHDGTLQKIYVNGQEKVSTNQAPGYINVSNYPLRIGGNGVWGEYFQGRIDEVRVYNYARSQSQIQTDMNTAVTDFSDPIPPASPSGLSVQ